MSDNFWSDEYECEITIMNNEGRLRGGQHVGRTESGVRVRIKRKDSLNVLIDIATRDRSQHKSRFLAMNLAELAYQELKL